MPEDLDQEEVKQGEKAAQAAQERLAAFEGARQQGRVEGHKEGYEEGYRQGHAEGLEKGFQEGNEEGQRQGYSDGHDKGFQEGRDAGFVQGREEGLASGVAAGKEEGVRQGQEEARMRLEEEVGRVRAIMEAMAQPLRGRFAEVGEVLGKMARDVVRAVLAREAKGDPEALSRAIASALETLPVFSRRPRLIFNPEDARLLESHGLLPGKDYDIEEDPALTRGGVQVEAEESIVDASLEERLSQALEKVYPED